MATSAQHHHENQNQLNPQENSSQVVVAMVPFPAQSHLNQLLLLSHVISSYNIPVHYIGSTIHNSQVKSRSKHKNPESKIQFHDISIPSLVSLPPSPNAKTKFPEHLVPCFEACADLRQTVASLLHSLSLTTRRLVIIHDVLMASAVQDYCSLPNAEAYCFCSGSAFCLFISMCEVLERKEMAIPMEDGKMLLMSDLPSMESCFPSVIIDYIAFQIQLLSSHPPAGKLINSCRALDGHFFELLERDQIGGEKKLWAVGNLHTATKGDDSKGSHKCLNWLDKQEPNSVLYVSFGTTTTLRDEEIEELALGLEQSGTKFIWVLRDADKVDIFSTEDVRRHQLPKGFEDRTDGVGILARDWVPQLEILRHPSTGGFMSHCGWNSSMESISLGVPIAAWPMHSDQPINAFITTEVLQVGVSVMKWAQRKELVSSSMISRAVKILMASEEGNKIRKRAEEMGDVLRKSTSGGNRVEWDSFVSHITR